MCSFNFPASSSVLKYLNAQNVYDHLPCANILNASTVLPCNSINNKNPSALLSSSTPSPNAYTNFMYANWIDLHTKIPDQTKYLFCLQGNLSPFFFLQTHLTFNHLYMNWTRFKWFVLISMENHRIFSIFKTPIHCNLLEYLYTV